MTPRFHTIASLGLRDLGRAVAIRSWAVLAALMVALAGGGCGDKDGGGSPVNGADNDTETDLSEGADDGTLMFPPGFQFGSAVAGFQVDMGCPTMPAEECEDRRSDWWAYVTSPITRAATNRTFLSGHDPSAGPGYWELYDQDHTRAKEELHNNSIRFSFEWSRIFPESTDAVADGDFDGLKARANAQAVAHYHRILDSMKARGLRPLATVNHYTLPLWIHDAVGCFENLKTCTAKGWADVERTVREARKYAFFLGREFGAKIDWWATINEPFPELLFGYVLPNEQRTHPPAGQFQYAVAKDVMRGLIFGHAAMYDGLKAGDTIDADGDNKTSFVGIVYPVTPFFPMNPDNALDRRAAERCFYLWNLVYLNAVTWGKLDADLSGRPIEDPALKDRMDYIGVNFYFRAKVAGTERPSIRPLSPLSTFDILNIDLGADSGGDTTSTDYPKGLYETVMYVSQNYGLPVIVTENGFEDPHDDGTAPARIATYLQWLHKAIADGADVRGYYYWTLLDNYEWNHGMNIRMGLYAVDKDDPTKTRRARKAVAVYGRIAQAGGIPRDILDRHPITLETPATFPPAANPLPSGLD